MAKENRSTKKKPKPKVEATKETSDHIEHIRRISKSIPKSNKRKNRK